MDTEIKLSIADVVRIIRKKRGLNQGVLGAMAFNTDEGKGQARIKRFEGGHQDMTSEERNSVAKVLNISPELLRPHFLSAEPYGVEINKKLLDMFPSLEKYIGVFNTCAELGQKKIIIQTAKELVKELALCNYNGKTKRKLS